VSQHARRSGLFAPRIKVRKTALTDCSSGRYSATSGKSGMRLVPDLYRAAYLSRTPPRAYNGAFLPYLS
jgi:hypothetical protein